MKKQIILVLATACLATLASCEKPEPVDEKFKVVDKSTLTIPTFEISLNGYKINNELMKNYDVYKAEITTTNSQGTVDTITYTGYRLNDAILAAEIKGVGSSLIATASDGYEVTWNDATNEKNLIAFNKNGNDFKTSPWFAPCSSETTGDYLKNCVSIKILGLDEKPEEKEEKDPTTLADPVKEDKTSKIKFGDYSFVFDGQTVKNADLEGLTIWRITVEVQKSSGTIEQHQYSGYLLKDVLAKLNKTATKISVVTSDGKTSELDSSLINDEFTLIAIECDKATGENGTIWLAPCSQHKAGQYYKLVSEIKIN